MFQQEQNFKEDEVHCTVYLILNQNRIYRSVINHQCHTSIAESDASNESQLMKPNPREFPVSGSLMICNRNCKNHHIICSFLVNQLSNYGVYKQANNVQKQNNKNKPCPASLGVSYLDISALLYFSNKWLTKSSYSTIILSLS